MRFRITMLVMLAAGVSPGFASERAATSSEVLNGDFAVVRINRQCQADPSTAVIDAKDSSWSPERRYQVLWIADKNDGDFMTITAKSARDQDPEDPARGLRITGLFESIYQIPGSRNAVTSGFPKLSLGPGSVSWRYDIEIRDAEGNVICQADPEICVKGGGGCNP